MCVCACDFVCVFLYLSLSLSLSGVRRVFSLLTWKALEGLGRKTTTHCLLTTEPRFEGRLQSFGTRWQGIWPGLSNTCWILTWLWGGLFQIAGFMPVPFCSGRSGMHLMLGCNYGAWNGSKLGVSRSSAGTSPFHCRKSRSNKFLLFGELHTASSESVAV